MKEGDKKIISNPTLRADCLLCVCNNGYCVVDYLFGFHRARSGLASIASVGNRRVYRLSLAFN